MHPNHPLLVEVPDRMGAAFGTIPQHHTADSFATMALQKLDAFLENAGSSRAIPCRARSGSETELPQLGLAWRRTPCTELPYHWHEAEISYRTRCPISCIGRGNASDQVDFSANETYGRDHMLMRHLGAGGWP